MRYKRYGLYQKGDWKVIMIFYSKEKAEKIAKENPNKLEVREIIDEED